MQFKRIKRPISGVLLLDKAPGISSNTALQQIKRLYQAEKAGHTGNLDPIATGLLPICLGEATKFSQYLLDANKSYQAGIKLGVTTTTGDIEGEVLARTRVAVSEDDLLEVLARFVGVITQIPPMYSALKHQGKALYTYAREGVEIERKARTVTIFSLTLDGFKGDELQISVTCSKGTYIRVLAEDIGRALGCGAHLNFLRRTATGGFRIEDSHTFEMLEEMSVEARDALLLSPDCLVANLSKVVLGQDAVFYVQQGQPVWLPRTEANGLVSMYGPGGLFLGLGEVMGDGKVAPRRLVVVKSPSGQKC